MRNAMLFQFLLKCDEGLLHPGDAIGRDNTSGENILPEADRSALVIDGLISAVGLYVCNRQTNGIASDINGGDRRHESAEIYHRTVAFVAIRLLKSCYRRVYAAVNTRQPLVYLASTLWTSIRRGSWTVRNTFLDTDG